MSFRLSLRQLPDESLDSPNGRRELGGAGFWRMYGSIFFRCSSFSREEGGTTCKTSAFISSTRMWCSSSRVPGASRGRRECTCTRAVWLETPVEGMPANGRGAWLGNCVRLLLPTVVLQAFCFAMAFCNTVTTGPHSGWHLSRTAG